MAVGRLGAYHGARPQTRRVPGGGAGRPGRPAGCQFPTPLRLLIALQTFRVRVIATSGPVTPSLADLSGKPPPGYGKAAAFASGDNHRPPGWFVERHDEFSPPLLILGTHYDLEACGEWEARVSARTRFAEELSRRELPLPPDPVHAEVTGWD